MTITNVTPTGDVNQPEPMQNPIDNMGNPINSDGTPREVAEEVQAPAESGETLESVQKALKDTKAELTRLQQEAAAGKEEPTEQPKEIPQELDAQQEQAVEAGVDLNKYYNEFTDNGKLSEDSYAELLAKGFSHAVVDDHIAGQQARADAQTKEVAEVVGGTDKLDQVLAWAGENMTPSEIQFYNDAVLKGTESAKLALEAINNRFIASNGKNPTLMSGSTSNAKGDLFRSPHDMQKAMANPLYWSDPDYQKDVAAKAARSKAAGTI